jgi:hypothetical protein
MPLFHLRYSISLYSLFSSRFLYIHIFVIFDERLEGKRDLKCERATSFKVEKILFILQIQKFNFLKIKKYIITDIKK